MEQTSPFQADSRGLCTLTDGNAGNVRQAQSLARALGGQARETVQVAMPEAGYDDWYAERRKTFGKYFKDKERARRSLEAELGPIRVERGLRDPALLDHLIALKAAQYRRSGLHDIFVCGWTRDLLHALMSEPREGFGASMAAMYAGDKLVAIEFSLHAGRHYHFWFPAYVPALARCSPGILLSMETIRLGSEQGFRDFDYGFGGEAYKRYFCDTVQPVVEATILRPGLSAALGQAGASLLSLAGADRGRRIGQSVRRRWNAIEACEVTPSGRLRGAAHAAGAALSKVASRGKIS